MKPTAAVQASRNSRQIDPRFVDAMLEGQTGGDAIVRHAPAERALDATLVADDDKLVQAKEPNGDDVLADADGTLQVKDGGASDGVLHGAHAAMGAEGDLQLAAASQIEAGEMTDYTSGSVAAKAVGDWGTNPLSMMLAQAETGASVAGAGAGGGAATAAAGATAAGASGGALLGAAVVAGVVAGSSDTDASTDLTFSTQRTVGGVEVVEMDFTGEFDWKGFKFADPDNKTLAEIQSSFTSLKNFDAAETYEIYVKLDQTDGGWNLAALFEWNGWENLGSDDKIFFVDSAGGAGAFIGATKMTARTRDVTGSYPSGTSYTSYRYHTFLLQDQNNSTMMKLGFSGFKNWTTPNRTAIPDSVYGFVRFGYPDNDFFFTERGSSGSILNRKSAMTYLSSAEGYDYAVNLMNGLSSVTWEVDAANGIPA